MMNARRVNMITLLLVLFSILGIVYGEIIGHRSGTLIGYLLVAYPLNYPSIYFEFRKKDLKIMRGKYNWILEKAFASEKKKYKKLLLSLGYLELDKYKKALQVIDKIKPLCTSRGDYTRLMIVEGMCFMSAKQYQRAYTQFSAILDTDPTYATVWAFQAINNLALGDVEAARKVCEQAMLYDAKSAWGYIGFALVYLNMGQYEMALAYALDAKNRNEEESLTLAVIGCCYKCLGDEEKVRDYLEKYTSRMEHEFTLYPIFAFKKAKRYGIAFRLRDW